MLFPKSIIPPILFTTSVFVNAEFLVESNEYSLGALGSGPFQTFFSEDFTPALWNFAAPVNRTVSESLSSGYIFMAPRGSNTNIPGARIFAQDGSLIWDASSTSQYPFGETMSFQIVSYLGEPHILVWGGEWIVEAGIGNGWISLLNASYDIVGNFTADLGDGTGLDFHDGNITADNTALITAYQPKNMDLTPYQGPGNGWVYNGVMQELNVTTGRALFTWKSLDHVDPADCFTAVQDTGTKEDSPWDYFHINSVDKDPSGNYLISSRHCSTVFYLNGTNGDILWRMGGRNSSFEMGNGTQFSWQHHARWMEKNETRGVMTLFDNANGGIEGQQDEASARGLLLELDFEKMEVDLLQDFIPFNKSISVSQGSVQLQPNGNFLVGWGFMPWLSEYTPTGDLLWSVQFGVGDVESYRALRFNWTGIPSTKPSINLVSSTQQSTGSQLLSIYASWNGATEISHWELLGSTSSDGSDPVSLNNKTKTGFETAMSISRSVQTPYGSYEFFAMSAIGRGGERLATSQFMSGAMGRYSVRVGLGLPLVGWVTGVVVFGQWMI